MAKVVFDNVPSILAKILGAYVIKVNMNYRKDKYYVLVLENLNLGIEESQECNILRYDLKGSQKNRFV